MLNADFDFVIQEHLNSILATATDMGVQVLRDNISFGTRSGKRDPRSPNQASTPDEFPQYQTGELFRSTGKVELHAFEFAMGFVVDVPSYAPDLEFGKTRNPDFPTRFARKPLSRTFDAVTTHERMNDAIRFKVATQ
jgi:hypothetical protein